MDLDGLDDIKKKLERERNTAAIAVLSRQQREVILGKSPAGDLPSAGQGASRTALVIINITVEQDPLQSWTFPASTELWEALVSHALQNTHSGASIVLVSASNSRKPAKLHTETVRSIMLTTKQAHAVIDGRRVVDSRTFWANWSPKLFSRSAYESDVHLRGARDASFPGELLANLSLVPQSDAILRRQTMFGAL